MSLKRLLCDAELSAAQAKQRIAECMSQRNTLIDRLNQFQTFLNGLQPDDGRDVCQLQSQIANIKCDYELFEQAQKSPEFLDNARFDTHISVRMSYDDNYYFYLVRAQMIMAGQTPSSY